MDDSKWGDRFDFEKLVDVNDYSPELGNDFDWTCPYCNRRNPASDMWEGTDQSRATTCCEGCDKETEYVVEYMASYIPVMPREEANER